MGVKITHYEGEPFDFGEEDVMARVVPMKELAERIGEDRSTSRLTARAKALGYTILYVPGPSGQRMSCLTVLDAKDFIEEIQPEHEVVSVDEALGVLPEPVDPASE